MPFAPMASTIWSASASPFSIARRTSSMIGTGTTTINCFTQIETGHGRYVLPMNRAAWIPAGTQYRTLVSTAKGVSLYFSPDVLPDRTGRVRILVTNPMMREMILYATRWPRGLSEANPLAASFLQTLALLCGEWFQAELPLFLPSATHPAILHAMDYAVTNLAGATQAGAIKAAAMSERSFRRRFVEETGMTWQNWITQARILMAMSLWRKGVV